MTTIRVQRMIDSAPDYYEQSIVYAEIQGAVAAELDRIDANNEDAKKQLRIVTATWGLRFWEERLGIRTNEADSYDVRRSRVLSAWRGTGNFSASLIESVAAAFSGGEVAVTFYRENLLLPFAGWALHANAKATAPYELELNGTGPTQNSDLLVKVKPGTTYTFTMENNDTSARVIIRKHDDSVTYRSNASYTSGTPITFTTDATTTEIYVRLYNALTGTFTFKNPMLTLGDVVKPFEPRKDFTMGIKFIGARGVPENLQDLKNQIDNIVHAHIGVEYNYTYLTYAELDAANKTWDQLDALNFTWSQFETWKP